MLLIGRFSVWRSLNSKRLAGSSKVAHRLIPARRQISALSSDRRLRSFVLMYLFRGLAIRSVSIDPVARMERRGLATRRHNSERRECAHSTTPFVKDFYVVGQKMARNMVVKWLLSVAFFGHQSRAYISNDL